MRELDFNPYISQPVILHLLGCNGTGKTTLCRHIDNIAGCRSVQVGQELRKRYPPEHFQGQAAPAATETEALEIYQELVSQAIIDGMQFILVDGQPRKATQVLPIHRMFEDHARRDYVLLHSSHDTRKTRLEQRDSADPGALELAMARLMNDYRSNYETMVELARHRIALQILDVTELTPLMVLNEISHEYLGVTYETLP